MQNTSPLVSIILLSYNRPNYLQKALTSIVNQTYKAIEIIVIDNKSISSAEIEKIVGNFPGVKLVLNKKNLGFSGGMNRGISEAKGFYIYLTEDDIIVDPHCVSTFVEYMQQNPSTGLASGFMYNESPATVRCAGGEVSLGAVYRLELICGDSKAIEVAAHPYRVTFIPGAMVFSTAEVLKQLNGFNKDFFMYLEDVELCVRLMKAGLEIVIVPQAKVCHLRSHTDVVSPQIQFHIQKNLYSLYILYASVEVLPEFACRYIVLRLVKALWNGKAEALVLIRALLWVGTRIPLLLVYRWSLSNRTCIIARPGEARVGGH